MKSTKFKQLLTDLGVLTDLQLHRAQEELDKAMSKNELPAKVREREQG